jgi:hypothetical protein
MLTVNRAGRRIAEQKTVMPMCLPMVKEPHASFWTLLTLTYIQTYYEVNARGRRDTPSELKGRDRLEPSTAIAQIYHRFPAQHPAQVISTVITLTHAKRWSWPR